MGQVDATDAHALAAVLAGQDVLISAFNPGKDETGKGARSIVDAAKQNSLRLLVVGGAGSLEIAPGKRLVDQPNFPTEWRDDAFRTAKFLDLLREETELDWVFLSPAAMIMPGERTGNLYLALAEAPFPTDDPTLNFEAGACLTSPRRTGSTRSFSQTCRGTTALTRPATAARLPL